MVLHILQSEHAEKQEAEETDGSAHPGQRDRTLSGDILVIDH
jgi:hypothetical protein